MKKRAQSNLEYILLTAVVLVILGGIIVMTGKNIGTNTAMTQAEDYVTSVANSVDEVYALGEGSTKYLNIHPPRSVESVLIQGKEINLRFNVNGRLQEVYGVTKANMTGQIDGNISRIKIEMLSSNVVLVNST